jgi:hypothetical protein
MLHSVPAEARVNVGIYATIAPPPPRVERVPAARRGYVWIAGDWRWMRGRYVWQAGRWERERRGYHYEAPHWDRDGDRWRYSEGRWSR